MEMISKCIVVIAAVIFVLACDDRKTETCIPTSEEMCYDNVDNDCNGKVDYEDENCIIKEEEYSYVHVRVKNVSDYTYANITLNFGAPTLEVYEKYQPVEISTLAPHEDTASYHLIAPFDCISVELEMENEKLYAICIDGIGSEMIPSGSYLLEIDIVVNNGKTYIETGLLPE